VKGKSGIPTGFWLSEVTHTLAKLDEAGIKVESPQSKAENLQWTVSTFASSDLRSRIPRFTLEARKANRALVDLIASIAERKKSTPAQIALAWLLAQKPWIVPIPGTTRLARIEENIGAADIELTADDLREIDSAASKITVQGARYPEELERMTYR
jgi:aryl-alcohol dehydrogenase-like predicted oxidoreductase